MANKFQPKSYPYLFIGYSSKHKGYRCYHPPTKKIYISRHVVFDENVLPYTNDASMSSSIQEPSSISTYYEFLKPQSRQASSSLSSSTAAHISAPVTTNQDVFLQNEHVTDVGSLTVPTTLEHSVLPMDPIEVSHDMILETHHNMHQVVEPNRKQVVEPKEDWNDGLTKDQTEEPTEDRIIVSSDSQQHYAENYTAGSDQCSSSHPAHQDGTNVHTMITRSKSKDFSSLFSLRDGDLKEPKGIASALKRPHWAEAMKEELIALQQNDTWELVDPIVSLGQLRNKTQLQDRVQKQNIGP
ncbi:hypothetical protein AAC387_Pa03g1810 [Persea americana]